MQTQPHSITIYTDGSGGNAEPGSASKAGWRAAVFEFNTLEDDDGRTPIESYLRDHFKKKVNTENAPVDTRKILF